MYRKFLLFFLFLFSAALLSSCGQSVEERIDAGFKAAQAAFEANDKQATEEVQGIQIYKPPGFTVSDSSDSQNIILKKKDDTFIVFVNPNEEANSELFYKLLKNEKDALIQEQVFSDDNAFGFVAVLKEDDEQVELIASVGGVKMTTVTKRKHIDEYLSTMMEVVRSIKQ